MVVEDLIDGIMVDPCIAGDTNGPSLRSSVGIGGEGVSGVTGVPSEPAFPESPPNRTCGARRRHGLISPTFPLAQPMRLSWHVL